jgi:Spy/CpxP family protein refolding chaperone
MERAFGPRGDHGRWWNNPKLVERLKLTEEQRKAFDSILLDHREKLIDLKGNMEKAELEMEPLMSAEQPNEAKILTQIDKVAQARAELEKANARFLLAIRAKLTPEQWKLLQADRSGHRPERRDGAPEGREPNRPGPGGQFQQQALPPVAPQGPAAPGEEDE